MLPEKFRSPAALEKCAGTAYYVLLIKAAAIAGREVSGV
jgi:hypothetical protein